MKSPHILLVGSFSDLYLEGIDSLKYSFSLNKSSKATKEMEVDIIVFDTERINHAIEYIHKYKAVPILQQATNYFTDYDPIKETGNSFIYKKNTPWHMLEATIRAVETYRFTYDWRNIKTEIKDIAKYSENPVSSNLKLNH